MPCGGWCFWDRRKCIADPQLQEAPVYRPLAPRLTTAAILVLALAAPGTNAGSETIVASFEGRTGRRNP